MRSVRSTEPLPAEATDLLNALAAEFRATAESVVPWFLDNMPPMYFQDTSADDQRAHLRSILAARTSGRPLDVVIKGTDGQSITAIRAGNRSGVLAEIVATLPLDASLRSAKIHSSRDGSLVIDTFEFGEPAPFDRTNPAQASKAEEAIRYAKASAPSVAEPSLRRFLDGCSAAYVSTLTPLRLTRHYEQFARVSGTDAAFVDLESEQDPTTSRITIAVSNARTRTMLERAARVLTRYGVNIVRAHLDLVKDAPHGSVTFLGFVVQWDDHTALAATDPRWSPLRCELERIKWLDFRVVEVLSREPSLSMAQCEALLAFGDLVRAMLVPTNPLAFSRDRVVGALLGRRAISCRAIDLFAARFDPEVRLDDRVFEAGVAQLRTEIDSVNESDDVATILHSLLRAISAVRRTNFFVPKRFSFALRLDAALLQGPARPEVPYGLFFVHGRGFHGFHVRFKEIARGGLRVVKPLSAALYERESERLYDEAYGLAFAQQLKNKDIPEGGAKAAIILEPPAETNRSVKAFVDGILDLITPEETTQARVLDHHGRKEFIFLGPDENITPEHIEWIVARARVRGYPLANAFMSSKPDGGINHKEYGVTSEGVNVFLRIALAAQGIDPTKRPFTVTITGGPDGDVAGNMMHILDRDYGTNARILGVADGSGTGEDPDGLDHAELAHLFAAGLPIASFDPAKLSPRGRIVKADHPEGVLLRNTLHNRIKADAFIPGGGRPATVNAKNWREFLGSDGKPVAPLVVEGANLFFTPEARTELSKAGTLIIKDSSANKCGVMCSSFEISSSMLLDEAAFLRIKATFVAQVLEKLRDAARDEAVVLLGEARRHPSVPLPELSTRLSRAITAAADAIQPAVASWRSSEEALFREVVLGHIPRELSLTVGERIFTELPHAYLEWMVAKSVASRIVYREGIDFFASMESVAVAEIALNYLKKDRELRVLIGEVRTSSLQHGQRIAFLLERAGTRAALLEID